MNKTLIAPSIISGDYASMGNCVKNLESYGGDYVHIDVMDGVFVPNITFGMPMVMALRPYSALPFDVHLMITQPEKYVESFIDAGADIITFHKEASNDANKTIELVKRRNKKVGLVLNPDKDVSECAEFIDKIDVVMLMGVYPGFSGQKFIESVINKIAPLKQLINKLNKNVKIQFDGGVSVENANLLKKLGVDILVAGSSVFNSADKAKAIFSLKNS